ncbi:MAG TPA: serine/threonine-protein kinase, partial [Minicystis sp.]|nr:serine/threonine-protein kinase [Minicystis sp.]
MEFRAVVEGASDEVGLARTEVATPPDRAGRGAPAPPAPPSLASARTVASPRPPSNGSNPAGVDVAPAPLEDEGFAARYDVGALIGEGGMGEVRAARDRRVGREVALKVVRAGSGSRSDARARFEREARVQGQLEHPSVVPVYDLGLAPDGAAFFTMKRVRGRALDEILAALRAGDAETTAAYGRRRLLGAFASACLAVAFAHARGVLHRDLKPGNLMLGSYGELYVLDWGLAKVRGAREDDARGEPAVASRRPDDAAPDVTATSDAKTVAGSILGTPGYMAPEQVRGDVDALDARCDVYALGAILFEMLTLEPLHRRDGGLDAIHRATLQGVDASPARRAPGAAVPPELDAICVRATALDPAERFPSARALHDALERYLDGDRDVAHRAELAERHAR